MSDKEQKLEKAEAEARRVIKGESTFRSIAAVARHFGVNYRTLHTRATRDLSADVGETIRDKYVRVHELYSSGERLTAACRQEGVTVTAFQQYRYRHPELFT